MRITRFLTLLLFLGGFMLHGIAQNVTLVVTTTNGVEHTYQMTEESQLYFNNGVSLAIEDGMGTTATYPLSEIRTLVCTETTNTIESIDAKPQVFPNPSRNFFSVSNLSGNCQGRIYTLDGRLVKEFEANEGTIVDISHLASGMYLLQMNRQTQKLMKL